VPVWLPWSTSAANAQMAPWVFASFRCAAAPVRSVDRTLVGSAAVAMQ